MHRFENKVRIICEPFSKLIYRSPFYKKKIVLLSKFTIKSDSLQSLLLSSVVRPIFIALLYHLFSPCTCTVLVSLEWPVSVNTWLIVVHVLLNQLGDCSMSVSSRGIIDSRSINYRKGYFLQV